MRRMGPMRGPQTLGAWIAYSIVFVMAALTVVSLGILLLRRLGS